MENSYDYSVFEIVSYYEIYHYHNYCEWPVLNIDLFKFYKNHEFKLYIAERYDFTKVPNFQGYGYPYDNYGISLLLIIIYMGKIISVSSRWNKTDILDKYLSVLQLRNVLGCNFINLINNHEYKILLGYDMTGIKGEITVLRNFGDHEPVLIYKHKNRLGLITIERNPYFLIQTIGLNFDKILTGRFKRWILLNQRILKEFWNREITKIHFMLNIKKI